MSGINLGYSTGSLFGTTVSLVEPAVTSITVVLNNPFYLAVILVLILLILIPGTNQ